MYNQHFDQNFLALAPSPLVPWLEEEGSLTDRLNQKTEDAKLRVIHQEWIRAGWWEKYVLHIQNCQLWQREIIMHSHGHICWYAKTLVEEKVFLRHHDFFKKVEQASLNQLLFREYKAQRQNKIYGKFNHDSSEFYWVKKALARLAEQNIEEAENKKLIQLDDAVTLWGRCSCFTIDADSSFYLIEIFLPGLLDATGCA